LGPTFYKPPGSVIGECLAVKVWLGVN